MTAVEVGAEIPERRVRADAAAMKVFSLLTDDPNPLHWDVAAVEAAGLGERPVNQGGLNVGYVADAVAAWAGSPADIRRFRVRFLGNVHAGDEVVAGGEVTAVRPANGGLEVELQVWLRGEDGRDLLTGAATVVQG